MRSSIFFCFFVSERALPTPNPPYPPNFQFPPSFST